MKDIEAAPPSPLASPEPWDLVSDDYALELLPMFELFSRDALTLAAPKAGARVLDVAAGPGTLTLLAARAGCSVSAIDFSPGMIANLRRRLAEAQLEADVRAGDGQALPWSDAEFDAAFSMFGLMFFPDRGKGFRELLRVLKPGGTAVVSSWAPFEGIFASIMAALREQLPNIPFGSGKGPLGDPAEFSSELQAAGFEHVNVSARTHTLPGAVPSEIWAQCQRTTAPIVLLKRKLGEARFREVTRGIVSRLEAEYGTERVDMTTTAYLASAQRP